MLQDGGGYSNNCCSPHVQDSWSSALCSKQVLMVTLSIVNVPKTTTGTLWQFEEPKLFAIWVERVGICTLMLRHWGELSVSFQHTCTYVSAARARYCPENNDVPSLAPSEPMSLTIMCAHNRRSIRYSASVVIRDVCLFFFNGDTHSTHVQDSLKKLHTSYIQQLCLLHCS